ncbi:hypothetical protein [Halocatena halophila]|uniref:hypothetical protein n=1 Tax=Halocatena halophila TaxID=2814576 RepID=UPI002ED5554F
MDDDVEFTDPETDEIVDISPGGETPDDLLDDPDNAIDYESATETWIGESTTVELRIPSLDGQDKLFLLEEPDIENTYRIIKAVLDGDRFELCAAIVREPTLTEEVWNSKLTGRERNLLYDHTFAWVRVSDFVSVQKRIP